MPNKYVKRQDTCPRCKSPLREKVEFVMKPRTRPLSFGGGAVRVFYDAKRVGVFCSNTKKCGIQVDRPSIISDKKLLSIEDKFNE
jgi:hypothetical protein